MKKRILQLLVLILVVSLCGSAFAYAATIKNITTAKKTVTISWSNPQDITYGTKLSSTQLNATATYNGVAVSGTYAYSPSVGTILSPGSQQTLKVTFTPTNRRVYSTAYKEVKINVLSSVTKVTPVISWATPADIVAGTSLGSAQLNATVTYNGNPVAGTYTYSPAAGTVLSAGASQTLKVTFTPTDNVKYNSATGNVNINVLNSVIKVTPLINWDTPADIVAGTPLNSTQLNATATYNGAAVPGTFAYSPAAGTVLSAGASQTLKVSFTPTDTVKYNPATYEVRINVLNPVVKVTPVINWTTPADIVAGTALSSTQLNATATYNGSAVLGTFVYSPATGTVLSAGASQTLKVTFTPIDNVRYSSAYKEVKINVLAPSASIPTDAINVKTSYGAKGDGITDDTAAINNAIAYAYSKGGGTVYIPDGTYLVNPLTKISMRSNVKLNLSNNAVLKSMGTSSGSYNIINIWQASNVSITGGKIIGDRAIHTGTSGEWGFGISMWGCTNVYIADISISDCWGDGIYIGSAVNSNVPSVMYCDKVVIERVQISNSRRSNISVISAKNLTIRDCVLSNAYGNIPEAGLNFEPNYSNEFIQNVIVENLQTYNNALYGIQLGLTMRNLTNPVDITIINHKDSGSYSAIGPWPLGTFELNHVVIK